MNEWKIVGIGSLVVNVLLVALLFVAVFIVKGLVEDKNAEVTKLENEVALLKNQTAVSIEVVEEPATEEAVLEDEPVQEAAPVKETPAPAPAKQPDYKKKLLSIKPSLQEDFEYVYFLYEGWPDIDMMLEQTSNADVTAEYEAVYQNADAVLNKVYGILKANLPESDFKQLQTEQRAWLKRVTKSKEDRLAMGGSSARLDVASELGYETRERTVELMMKYFQFEDPYGN